MIGLQHASHLASYWPLIPGLPRLDRLHRACGRPRRGTYLAMCWARDFARLPESLMATSVCTPLVAPNDPKVSTTPSSNRFALTLEAVVDRIRGGVESGVYWAL